MLRAVQEEGFVLYKRLATGISTNEVAQTLGTIINVDELLPSAGIPTVQSLRPRNTTEVGQNQYSGHYGLLDFPLHTDLAHWAIPPRYLLLRCLVGTNDVFTNLHSWLPIVELLGKATLQRAVFRARRRRVGYSGLVRVLSHQQQTDIFRWDPLFLRPLNRHAEAVSATMLDPKWNDSATKILLTDPGDSILVDNWRILHGRSPVLGQSKTRHIERVYLSEVF